MAKMDRSTVIYGGDTARVVVSKVSWKKVKDAIETAAGPDVKIVNLSKAKEAVVEAMQGTNAAKTYVKVGVVGKNLVLRIKTPGVLKDTEVDVILVANGKDVIEKYTEENKLKAQEVEEPINVNNNEAVREAADKHLTLRKDMVEKTQKFKDDAEEVRSDIETLLVRSNQYLEQMQGQPGKQERMSISQNIANLKEQAEELYEQFDKKYKAFTRSGSPLMVSRQDFAKVSSLPATEQNDYKRTSGGYFRQASQHMEDVVSLRTEMTEHLGALAECYEKSEDLTGAGIDSSKALARLEDIRNDADELIENISRRFFKFEQSIDRNSTVWQTILNGKEELKPQRTKSFNLKTAELDQLIEAIKKGKTPLDQLTRRLVTIPGDLRQGEVDRVFNEIQHSLSELRLKVRRMPALIAEWNQLKVDAAQALA